MSNKRDPFATREDDRSNKKMVGAYVPRPRADYIALLAIHKNCTISKLLLGAIDYYLLGEETEAEEIIIQELCNRAHSEWKHRLEKEEKRLNSTEMMKKWREYQQELKTLLKKKKISDEKADEVIEHLDATYGHEILL